MRDKRVGAEYLTRVKRRIGDRNVFFEGCNTPEMLVTCPHNQSVSRLTSIQGSEETPVSRMDSTGLRAPARPPFHPVSPRAALPFRPEVKVE